MTMSILSHYGHKITRGNLPLIWIFFATYRCNSKCTHCFYWKELNSSKRELEFEEIKKISSKMGYFRDLLISGGEPTLREDIADICFIFSKKNKVKAINFPTNGLDSEKVYNQVEAILKKCKGVKLNVGLPLDGLEKTNDRLRGMEESFKKTIRTVEKLAKLKKTYSNLITYIATTVSNENYNEILPLAKLVKTLPVNSHRIFPIRGLPKDSKLKPPSASKWRALHSELLCNDTLVFKKTKSFVDIIRRNRAISTNSTYSDILEGKFITPCTAGKLLGVIEPDGGVRLCELTQLIGNLRSAEYNIKSIWFSREANNLRKKLKRCFCTHGCFLTASRDNNIFLFFKSLLGS